MGGRPPAPRVEYIPAPPPPVTVSTPTQSLKTQVELTRISGDDALAVIPILDEFFITTGSKLSISSIKIAFFEP